MFGMLKLAPYLIIIALAGYGYHTVVVSKKDAEIADLRSRLDIEVRNAEQLEIAQETQKATISRLEEERDAERERVNTLTSRNNELQRDKDNYLKIFRDHNLTRLARGKPGMIEKRINNGTEAVFRQVEEDTKFDAHENE